MFAKHCPWVLRWTVAAVLVLLDAVPALAQPDPNGRGTYGVAKLRAGFLPDPHVKSLTAGGQIRTFLGGVNAYVAKRPDYTLHYTKGSYPLTIYVDSKADTTLLVHTPDGKWVANDDTRGYSPLVRFASPLSGQYQIWVGTYGPEKAPANLKITEQNIDSKPAVPEAKKDKVDSYVTLTLNHEAGYVAKFLVSWKEKGVAKSHDFGSRSLGWSATLKLPRDATDIRVHAQAAFLVGTWRDIYDGPVTPGSYTAAGTTLKRTWRRNK